MYTALYTLTGLGFLVGTVSYAYFSVSLGRDIREGRIAVREETPAAPKK